MLRKIATKAAPTLAGLGLIGVVIGSGQADPGSGSAEAGSHASAMRCEIAAKSSGGMLSLEGVVEADVAVSGFYEFRIVGAGAGGNATIQQAGVFAAGPDAAVTLGRVMLAGSGAYDASLTLEADGETIECAERFSGSV